ncbi:MAG: PHB depolymerase family esterase [Vicingaceae bacterium]|jgi:poly(3-hydroxybutyrate) depolymerase
MRFLFSIILLSLTFSGFSQTDLTQVVDFGKNKGNLKMYQYIPKNIDESNTIPLVVVAHGCTQSAKLIANETGWNKLADSLNFIVIYPEQKQINNVAKCYNFYLGFKAKKDKGEVASIKQMIDFSFKTRNIDSTKIFITGFSAGGGISNAMLNAYPTLFNAGALFAAPSNLFKLNKETSEKQPKVVIIQGDKDVVVPKGNANRILEQWVKKNQFPDSSFVITKEYLNHPLLTLKEFINSKNELKITLLSVKDLKHKLMISPGKPIDRGGEMDFHTVDLNFHSTYWVAQFFGLTKD